MANTKKLGIWMDHSSAHLIEFISDQLVTTIIESEFTHEVKADILSKSERFMHSKEQHMNSSYYKKLSAVIKNFDEVILFGPTEAKVELFNLLKADQHFAKIKIEVRQTDKMTENQEQAFVREYFSKKAMGS